MRKLLWTLLVAAASAQQVNQDIIPASSGLNLGHSNQRWNGFFQNLDILGTCTVNGSPCLSTSNAGQVTPGSAGQIPVYSGPLTIAPDANIDDNVSNPGAVTSQVPLFMPQLNLFGTGGLAATSSGGTLPTLPDASGNRGGFGIDTGAIPKINPNALGWSAIPIITVNGVAMTNTTNTRNFNSSTPAAPTNGINMQCQVDSNGNLSCAIVGDGNGAHAFCGNGTFAACTAGGATALSGLTAATGANTTANGNFGQIWQWALNGAAAVGITDTESAAATGGTPLTQAVRQVSTIAGSTAVPMIVGNSLTGSQTLPAIYFNPTWNTTGLATGVLFNVTNTASGAASILADWQVNGNPQVRWDKAGNVYATNSYGGMAVGTSVTFCAGQSACGSSNTNAQVGSYLAQGADTSSSGASAKAGPTILRGGMLTAVTPNAAALEGFVQIGAGGLKGAAIANVGDVLTGTPGSADTLTDCPLGCTAIVGIATNTSNPISYVMYGTTLVKLDGALAAINDHICGPPASTGTIGLAHDNGASLCPSGQNIGIALANVGTPIQMSGNSTAATAMSTTLVKVALHIGD